MKTQIYLIRHGQSEGNKLNLFLGHTDLDLTEEGHAQAEKTAEYLSDIHVDVIYSSDLLRAYHTAEHTAKKKGMEIVKNQNLREIFAGEWECKRFDELWEKYAEDFTNVWCTNIGRSCPTGGESVEALQKRFVSEVEKLARENEGKTIFIFTHATPIRVLKTAWDGVTLDDMKDIPWASNASVTHCEYADGVFKVLKYSIDDFMGDMATSLPSNV